MAEMLALIGEDRLSSDLLQVYSTGKILKYSYNIAMVENRILLT